ncbi:pentatricopeptide repeat-containing protein At4g17616 [Humulus lupulus]|uniref:pentatricopeptide repeat-containing protein At4g17616 n=1 Tax=Humulus lupulus TaxID=3486 RepID=UPI002B413E2F|nr:pentatricopeptide repeat-containing protein At4g17616 [Humulus lupulus]XP_062082230.1 pentatricopeptide repeat-containing protein At4g17616 [Humulus lupulus]
MALLLMKEIRGQLTWSNSLRFRVASATCQNALVSTQSRELYLSRSSWLPALSNVCCVKCQNSTIHHFSTSAESGKLCWEGSSHGILLKKLKTALQCRHVDEAWVSFSDFRKLHGFPEASLVHRLITELSYSSEPYWLRKACSLVLLISKEKSYLLQGDVLTKLTLSLARSQLPNPATVILRLMLEKDMLPSMNVLWLVVLHLVKTEIGTHLASNFLAQLCGSFVNLRANKSKHAELIKPDTMIFNLVLDACVRFKLAFKGQHIMELMSQTGVLADAHSIIIIAQIHEMSGQRDELKKYKVHVDQVLSKFVCHYRQYYDSLLSLHFKFNDFDAVAELVGLICKFKECLPIQRDKNLEKIFLVPIGSYNLKDGLKMQIQPELLQKDTVLKVESRQELILFRNGKLVLSYKALSKLIKEFKTAGRVSELSKLLLGIQKEQCSLRGSDLCSNVIDACVHLGWLELAHDILDDMESSNAAIGVNTYMLLLTAYFKGKMLREAKALLKQMRKVGMPMFLSDKMVVTESLSDMVDNSPKYDYSSNLIGKSDLYHSLIQEVKDEKLIPSMVFELNSSIYYFCKAKMIEDAMRTYKRMQEINIQPTLETFTNLVCGYSSLGMYRDITILWGDIKRSMEFGNLSISRDLCEHLLMNFLQGGYFEKVMEIINYMKKHNMFTDKWMYRTEFLKLHKNLYKNLNSSEARTEAQKNRLRYVLAFRKWADID